MSKKQVKLVEVTPPELYCGIGPCPAIFKTEDGSYIIIGRKVIDGAIYNQIKERAGEDESAIEVPARLIEQLTAR